MVIQDVLHVAGFSEMPFRIVPPAQMEKIVWAGDDTIIKGLYEAARATRVDNLGTTEFLVVYGEYGSGKTNALKWLVQKLRSEGQLVAYVVRPSVLDKPTWHDIARSLFTNSFQKADIIKRLSILRQWALREAESRARTELGGEANDPDKLRAMRDVKQRDLYAEVLPDSPGFVRFAIEMADPNAQGTQTRNWSYLAEATTRQAGSIIATEYNLPPDGFGSDYSATLLLTSFVKAMTYKTPLGMGSQSVALLMDEMEGLNDLPPASRQSVQQGLRELINACTEHMFIAVASSASDASEIWGILDNPLMQRLSRMPVQMPQLEEGEAKQFLLDIMRLNRTSEYERPAEWPFSEDGLDAFVQQCPRPLTPRKLLVSAQRLLFQAEKDKVMNGEPITAEDVRGFLSWAA